MFWKKKEEVVSQPSEREQLIADKICDAMINDPDAWRIKGRGDYSKTELILTETRRVTDDDGRNDTDRTVICLKFRPESSSIDIMINEASVSLTPELHKIVCNYAKELVQEKLIRSLDRKAEGLNKNG